MLNKNEVYASIMINLNYEIDFDEKCDKYDVEKLVCLKGVQKNPLLPGTKEVNCNPNPVNVQDVLLFILMVLFLLLELDQEIRIAKGRGNFCSLVTI